MSRGPQRHLIPYPFSDLSAWPAPDLNVISQDEKSRYLDRKLAVEMYADNESSSNIKNATGKSANEIVRLVRKCLSPNGQGGIAGFTALLTGSRTGSYIRQKKIVRRPGDTSAGCAGALGQLFSKLPDVEAAVQEYLFKTASREIIHEARISYRSIHREFIKLLRNANIADDEWPFNTQNRGYNALIKYCHRLRDDNLGRWVSARVGKDAARRGVVGNGYKPLIPVLRPYSHVQLDFHKIDASSIILLENDYGGQLEIPLSRWHIGLLADERSSAVLGACVALESNPSGDSVLETIESALIDYSEEHHSLAFAFLSKEKILPNQYFSELRYQCFSSLKMDNAWSNSATEVVNNVIDTVGCAVNFGPVRAWWRRSLIERIFGELTRKGLQRLPSTYGNGASDTRRCDPTGTAVAFKIMLSELIEIVFGCIQQYNNSISEGLQFTTPLNVLQSSLAKPLSGFFPQPLATQTQNTLTLLSHIEEGFVRGNLSKHIRPHIRSDRCRYTNDVLANSYHLIGKKLVLYINRRDVRQVRATIKDTGEDIGFLLPERRWSGSAISVRERKIINRSGLAMQIQDEREDVVAAWGRQKKEQMILQRKEKRKRLHQSKDALSIVQHAMRNTPPSNVVEPESSPDISTKYPDPFGLYDIPNIKSVDRRR